MSKYSESKIYELNIYQNLDTKTEYPKKKVKTKQAEWTLPVVLTVIASSFGIGMPYGYCMSVINSPAVHMRAWCNRKLIEQYDFHLSSSGLDLLWATVVSLNLATGMLGALMGGGIADRFGRRGAFLLNGLLMLFGAICFCCCRSFNSVPLLLIGRFIVGLASGMASTSLPMYHSEIAAVSQRGTLSVGFSLGITLGTLLSQLVSMEMVLGDAQHWHLALSAYAIVVVIVLVPFRYYPESPKYLYILKNNCNETHLLLKRLRGNICASVIDEEIHSMQLEASLQRQTIGYRQMWTDKTLRMPLVLYFIIEVAQPLAGIYTFFYYSDSIFRKAGLQPATVQWLNLGTGFVNLAAAMFTPLLNTIFNRRALLMTSSMLCAVFLVAFPIMENNTDKVDWFVIGCIASIYLSIVAYQLGLGSIPSFIGTELFAVRSRSAALSVGNLLGWLSAVFVAMSFPMFQSILGSWTFFIFAANCIFLFFITKYYLPETRGHATADIVELLSHGFKRTHQ